MTSDKKFSDGLLAVCSIARFYRIPIDPTLISKELSLKQGEIHSADIVRVAKFIGMKGRIINKINENRLLSIPLPAIAVMQDGKYCVLTDRSKEKKIIRVFSPATNKVEDLQSEQLISLLADQVILLQRQLFGKGRNAEGFSLAWFLPTIKRYKKPLAHVVLASFFIQFFALITPLFFQVVIDKVLVNKSYATLIVVASGLICVHVFDVIFRYIRTYVLNHTANRIDVELGSRLFTHLFSLPIKYFESRNTGSTVARIRELESIRSFFTGQALSSVIDLFFIFIFMFVLFFYSKLLATITLISIPCYLLVSVVMYPFIKKRINEKFLRSSDSQQFMVESVVGAQTIKAASVEPLFRSKWEEKMACYVRASFQASQTVSIGQNSVLLINKIFSVLILAFGADSVIHSTLSVGGLIAFNMISGQVVQPILRMSQLWQDFQQIQVSVERLGDIIDQPPEYIRRGPVELPKIYGNITFDKVNFSYKHNSAPILQDICLNITAGEVIGIVGASGSGKSTLTRLMQRLYLPSAGHLYIDGQDINSMDPGWLRQHTGVVLQENLLFTGTIYDNIAFAVPGMTKAQAIRVARMAGADEFISKLPDGYDTLVEERGSNLSGGQRQRIAIARALANNPPILILDEATSALDYESEHIIRKNMKFMVQGRTVIIIAHRLSTVRNCDRIISMENGRIMEQGTHHSLLENNGIYARLWSLQNADDESGDNMGENT